MLIKPPNLSIDELKSSAYDNAYSLSPDLFGPRIQMWFNVFLLPPPHVPVVVLARAYLGQSELHTYSFFLF